MAYPESELIPISALQHLVYCERQFALIHVEGVWNENLHTTRGRGFHERAHSGKTEVRGTLVRSFGVPVRSLEFGLVGVTDAVEFRYSDETLSKIESVTPVEYKVGAPKKGAWDAVQVTAQALCLEEMTGVEIPEAFLYYGKTHRRVRVYVDARIRAQTESAALRAHVLIQQDTTPRVGYDPKKCDACSLFDICKPRVLVGVSASAYMERAIAAILQD